MTLLFSPSRCWWRVGLLLAAACCVAWLDAEAAPPTPETDDFAQRRFITPNEFEGTDGGRINQAIEAAAAAGCRVVIPRVNFRDAGHHDVLIENITGYTGDDLIALTAIPRADSVAGRTTSTMVSAGADRGQGLDDIRHIILRNIKGYSRGGHHIVRLLNTSGVRMHDILLDGLIDTSPDNVRCKAAVKVGDSAYGGGIAPLGDTYRIIVDHVTSKSSHTVLIGGSLSDSILTNIIRYGAEGDAVTFASGPEYVRDVTITNVHVMKD